MRIPMGATIYYDTDSMDETSLMVFHIRTSSCVLFAPIDRQRKYPAPEIDTRYCFNIR